MKQMWKKVVAFTLASAVVLGAMPVNIGPGGLFGGTAIVARAESIIVDYNEVTISTDTTCDYEFYVHGGGLVIDQGVTLMFESGGSYFLVHDDANIELHGTMAGDISDWECAECYDNSYIHVYLSDGAKYTVTGLSCSDDDCIRYYGYDAATDGGGTVSVKDEDGETDVTPETIGYETTTYTYTAIPAKGYKFKNWTKGAGGEILDTEASIEVTCAQNGQYQVYANFEVDINSFNQSADVNPTITFGSDYVDNLTVTRDDGVIDLNGHAITGNVFLQNNNPDKTVTIKNGTITGEIDGAPAFNDFYKGKVVLENVTVGGTIWTDGHDYTISGGTYNGIIFALKNSETIGSTTITDGIFNGSLISGFGNPVVEGGTFSVSGGTFAYRPVAEFMANGYSAYWNEGKYTVSENNLNEVTSKIVNPSFENGTVGWEFKASDDSGSRDANNDIYRTLGSSGNWLFNTWGQGWNVHQTVTGLTNGKYRLTAVVASTGSVVLRANGVKGAAATTNNAAVGTLADMEFYVTDGTATIGAEGVDNVWFKCDDFRLFYLDDSQPEPTLAEENDYTSYVKNPDFEYGSGYGWTFDNSSDPNETGVFYTVSPYTIVGQSGNYIYNTWYTGGLGNPISQTVTGLPNGTYRLVAIAGPANGVVIKGNGQTSELAEEGEVAVEFEVTNGTAVIGAEGVNNSWFKVDNFRLYLIDAITYEKVEAKPATYAEEGNGEYYVGSNGNYYVLEGEEYVEIEEDSWVIPMLVMAPAMNVSSDSSKLSVNVYIPIADGYALDSYSVTFGDKAQTLTEVTVGEQNYGMFSVTCAAKEMADLKSLVISADHAEVYRNDGLSAASYLNNVIDNSAYSAYHDVAKAMLRYGAAAQTYFNYNTSNLANAGVDGYGLDSLDGISITNTSPTVDQLKEALTFEKSEYYAMNMSFTSDTSMMIAFKIKSGETADEAISELEAGLTSSTFSNITYTADLSGKYVIVKVENIPIKRLGQTIFSVGGLEVKATDYLSKVVNNESANANLKNLCKALHAFYQSATAE